MSRKKILIICGSILLVAVVVIAVIFLTEPTAQSEGATRESAMLVSVEKAEKGDYEPVITATGIVRPVEDVNLSPLVSGQVIHRASGFVPGGFVKKGDVLLRIDPSDYHNNLELRKSELLQAKTDLEMEMGRQKIAEQDLQLIGGDSLSVDQRELVLRKPQLNAVKARIQSAEAAVDQAQTNLSRTVVRAPFDAHVISQNVTIGSQVSPGDNLGRLVGIDQYWVNVTLPVGKLKWLSFPENEEDSGAKVRLKSNSAWGEDEFRIGYLDQQIGALDNQTRLARLLIEVPDPLGHIEGNDSIPKLIIGGFVEAHIQAKEIKDVVRLNRDYVRNNETVWVMKDEKLEIRDVEILLTDSQYAYIKNGLNHNDNVVTTNLSTVTNGVRLRTEENTISENSEN